MIKNIDRIREIKVRLRRCNLICDELELLLNHSTKDEKEIIIKFLTLKTEAYGINEILEKGD